VTIGTLEEMHSEVMPHPAYSPNLVPGDFHLLGPLKEALDGKGFRTYDEVKHLCNNNWKSNHNLFFKRGIMKLPA
jgi:hypothetical protein